MPQHAAMQPSVEARPRSQPLGCVHTPGAPAPWWGYLTTAFTWLVPRWAWASSTSVLGLDLSYRWASLFISFAYFCITFFVLRLLLGFVYFPLVFECVSCKTCFLQYKWNYVNSKGICVKRLFISPILDYNWSSDLIDSVRQPIIQA